MSLHVACPNCGSNLSIPAIHSEKMIRCPVCKSTFRVEPDEPSKRKPRPHRTKRFRPKAAGLSSGMLVAVILGLIALVIAGVGVGSGIYWFSSRGKPASASAGQIPAGRGDAKGDNSPVTTGQSDAAGASNEAPRSANPYVFGESERKLEELFAQVHEQGGEAPVISITEEEVYAIMGPPTVREKPVTFPRNGLVLTVYKARWIKRQGASELHTLVTFVNGKALNVITARTNPNSGSNDSPAPADRRDSVPGDNSPVVRLSRPAETLILGRWECEIPAGYQPNARRVSRLHLEFSKDGTCSFTEYGPRGEFLRNGQGTWKLDKSEANNLWIQLALEIPIVTEGGAMNHSQLFVFRNNEEWETRGLLKSAVAVFRRR